MFFKKYKFPLSIFVVFEHTTPVIYTSEILSANHYVSYINTNWYYPINNFLKKELFFSTNSLIEMSAIDTFKYDNLFPELNFSMNQNRLLLFNIYYCYTTKLRLTLFYNYSLNTYNYLESIDKLYKNANWLERELSEMFSPLYSNKIDTRTLLLDYPKGNFPLLKDFPTESWSELYYDFLDKSLHYSDVIDHTEL